MKQLAKTKTK